MEISRTPISGLIFDAGDIIVHKIPDNQVKAWNEIFIHLKNSNFDSQEQFNRLYEKVRTLGIDFKSECTSTIRISLIEEYEIEKWWRNPDPLALDTISKLWEMGYKIGILTDSALPFQTIREVLGPVSLYVHEIVSSRDIGVMKPHKQMYFTILAQLEISPDKAVFIAHDPEEIKGALESGLLCENFESIRNLQKLVELIQKKYVLAQ